MYQNRTGNGQIKYMFAIASGLQMTYKRRKCQMRLPATT